MPPIDADQKVTDQPATGPAVDETLHDAPLETKLAATDEKATAVEELPAPAAKPQPDFVPPAQAAAPDQVVGQGAPETASGAAAAEAPAETLEARVAAMEDSLGSIVERVATIGKETAESLADIKSWLENEMLAHREALDQRHDGYTKTLAEVGDHVGLNQRPVDGENLEEVRARGLAGDRPHIEDRLAALESIVTKLRHFA